MGDPMILAVDTSTEILGVALFDGQRILWETERVAHKRHTVELAPTVDAMLRGAGIKVAELTALAVTIGPGSFTALRIGIAFAVGMTQVSHIPLVGIPTLDVLATGQPVMDGLLITVLRVGRGRVAAADYRYQDNGWRAQGEPRVNQWQQLADQIPAGACICGEIDKAGFAILEKRKDVRIAAPHLNVRRAGVLAMMAAHRLRDDDSPLPPLHPMYINTLLAAGV
jgi:tRNA threonylcarbamoyladenosine biosynthesis protein TsaB